MDTPDIVQLGSLAEPDPIGWDEYEGDAGAGTFSLPPEGVVYTGSVPQEVGIGKTQANILKLVVAPVIISGPTHEGFEIRYGGEFSATKYKKRKGTPAGDFVRSAGVIQHDLKTNADYVDAAAQTQGGQFQFTIQWRGRCKSCSWKVEGMRNFPSDGNGGYQSWQKCPQCGAERVWANVRIAFPVVNS